MTSIAIIEAGNTTYVPFNGQQVLTAMAAGVAYVAMRPIVENLGMSWSTQVRKLSAAAGKFNCIHMNMVGNTGCVHMNTPLKGGIQKMLCIPLKKLNGWLFSINPEKVRADIRDKLIQYQEECFTVLHDYWTKGDAKRDSKQRKSTATQLIPLRQTAERLIATGLGKIYPDIWKLVHQRFDIEHIHQLEPVQIGDAIDYLNALEGEFLGKQEALPVPKIDLNYPEEWWDKFPCSDNSRKIVKSSRPGMCQFPVRLLFGFIDDAPSAIGDLIAKLTTQGYDMSAVKMEYLAHRHYAEQMYKKLSLITELSGSILGSCVTLSVSPPVKDHWK